MRNVAKNALCYGLEAGLNLSAFFSQKKCPVIYPYARYEYYNPQEEAEGSATMEKRCQVSKWTAGVNWFALPNLVVKADYTTVILVRTRYLDRLNITMKMNLLSA